MFSRSLKRWIFPTLAILVLVFLSGCQGKEATYEDDMAEEHAGETPAATPAAKTPPTAPVETSEVVYATVDGQEITGYLARPQGADGGEPAVIVIHEWWGLNDNIRSMADRLAGEGYTALAVDLYGGEAAETPEKARELATSAGQNPEPAKENLRLAYTYLETQLGAPKIGSIGWCFGGGWSLQTALMLPGELDAATIYYGRLVTDPEELTALETPILGIFGEEDGGIPVETVREFESALVELGKDAKIHVYPGADHAFANPSGERYNAEAAEDAWERTLAFFAEHLSM